MVNKKLKEGEQVQRCVSCGVHNVVHKSTFYYTCFDCGYRNKIYRPDRRLRLKKSGKGQMPLYIFMLSDSELDEAVKGKHYDV